MSAELQHWLVIGLKAAVLYLLIPAGISWDNLSALCWNSYRQSGRLVAV